MRWTYFFCLLFFVSAVPAADPQPIPLVDLPSFFQSNGINYQFYGTFNGVTKKDAEKDVSYKFLPYPHSPSDEETMGMFFEFQLGAVGDLHLAAGLRGPVDSGNPIDTNLGRGIGIGNLSLHKNCKVENGYDDYGGGFFIEDWSARKAFGQPAIYATECELIYMQDNATYRVDIHVSKLNAYVAVWRKHYNYWYRPPTYTFVGDHSCIIDKGEWCEEILDSDFPSNGNGFITVSGTANRSWKARNIFVAHW